MKKKLLSCALVMATTGVLAADTADTQVSADVSVATSVSEMQSPIMLTVQVVKNDGTIVSESVKFTRAGMQHDIDGMVFEVVTTPDEQGYAALDLKIYRKDEQGEMTVMCQGNGKIALNKEEVVQITERTNDDEVVQTITLTFLVAE